MASPEKKNNSLKTKSSDKVSGKIREDLVEHYDYFKVNEDVWNHFYSWYGADKTIFRYIQKKKELSNSRNGNSHDR